MELRLRIEVPGRNGRDLLIEIDGWRRVDELTSVLAERCGLTGATEGIGLYNRRQGRWLPPETRVGDAGLRWGDQAVLAPAGSALGDGAGEPPAVRLLVTGGPSAGLSFPLSPGEHQVGRSPECDVVLEDPAISRVHMLVTVGARAEVVVADAHSSNGIVVDGRRLRGRLLVAPEQELQIGRSLVAFAAGALPAAPAPDATGFIPLNRPPRELPQGPRLEFSIHPPEGGSRSAAFSLTTATLPLGMGLLMYFYTQQALMLAMAFLSPLMVVGTFLEQYVGGRRQDRVARERFGDDLRRLAEEMARSHQGAKRYGSLLAPDLADLTERAAAVSPTLWDRRVDQPDFLLLRIGWGERPSGIALRVERGGAERLRRAAQLVEEHFRTLRSVPISISLAELGSVGLTGPPPTVLGLARSLVLQAALQHSPKDLMLVAAAGDLTPWRWLGWLPHTHPEAPPVPGRPVAGSAAQAQDLVERLLGLIAERQQAVGLYGEEASVKAPAVLALLDGSVGLPRGPVDRLLREGPAQGVFAIWLGSGRTQLPGDVGAVVEVNPSSFAPRIATRGKQTAMEGASSDLAPLRVAERTALALAAVRDIEATAAAAEIPRYVGLLGLLGLTEEPADRIAERWRQDDGRLAAALGIGAAGRPAEISLRNDGPHGLAGGMTGAGKSELLQTMVASLAASHSPARLTFILVDYKGGAAFKDCVSLPHTVGFVTDLDGHLVNRALTSLRAELRRREEVLRQHGYRDLVDFEERDPANAFPSLLIVVDEFAALATELPEFVDGMVDVAQRGRSLGIHLVLATQRPAGVITNRIRTNTNLRISLRFSDEDDSKDVIGTSEAARPGLPRGRAFARTGPGKVIEFQAAHASGHTATDGGTGRITVRDVDPSGNPVDQELPDSKAASDKTDLQSVVEACREAAERLGIPQPSHPWLPALPEIVSLESLEEHAPEEWRGRPTVPLGLVDEPAAQRQSLIGFGLEEDGVLLVYGGPRSGKTTLLRTLTVAACRKLPPEQLHVYAIDHATRALQSLTMLPHCGGVVMGDEPERTARLLTMLWADQDRRKAALAERGASTLAEYHAMGGEPLPYILVLIDGYRAFHSQLADLGYEMEAFYALLGESRALGMGFLITADRPGALPVGLAASITRRVVLSMSTQDEYLSLGVRRSLYEGAVLQPGRGFTEQSLEVQVPVMGHDPGGRAQNEQVEQLARELRRLHPSASVPEVRLLPVELDAGSLPPPAAPMEAAIGLMAGELAPAWIDLREGNFLIAGPRRSGRSTALAAFACSLLRAPDQVPVYLMAPRPQSPLTALQGWTEAAVGTNACADLAARLVDMGRSWGEDGTAAPQGMIVLLDDGEEVVDSGPASNLETLVGEGRDKGIRLVAAIETRIAHRTYGGWFPQVQRDRRGFVLDPDPAMDGSLFGNIRLPRFRSKLPSGRGLLITTGVAVTVQLAQGW